MLKQVKEIIIRHKLIHPGDRVLVGVSGGPDSLSLLHILRVLSFEMDFRLYAAHLNHGLRPGSAGEADHVRSLAAKWGIPCHSSTAHVSLFKQRRGLSVQESARLLRYHFLLKAARSFNANKIALGHHRDDQVETVLLNILSGAGIDGLSGMKIKRRFKGITVIRPLFEVQRSEIERYCLEQDLDSLNDESNLKTAYRRNKVRLELIPCLEKEYNPRIRDTLFRMSALLSGDLEYLHKKALLYLKLLSRPRGDMLWLDTSALKKFHVSMQRRVVKLALQKTGQSAQGFGMNHVQAVMGLYQNTGKTGKELYLPGRGKAYMDSDGLALAGKIRKASGPGPVVLNIPGKTVHPGSGLIFNAEIRKPAELRWPPQDKKKAYLDYDSVKLPLTLSHRWDGARFKPLGLGGKSKKLKDYLIDRKIPRRERDSYPLVISGKDIVWVSGQSIAYPYRVKEDTRLVLVLSLIFSQRQKEDGISWH